jgi:hypothetical protein
MFIGEMTREDLLALNLYLVNGYNFRQVEEESGVSRGRLKGLLARPDVQEILAEEKANFVRDLEAVQGVVVNAIKDMLMSDKDSTRLAAIDRWGRLTGKFKDNLEVNDSRSAEDVAKALLVLGDKNKEVTEDVHAEV